MRAYVWILGVVVTTFAAGAQDVVEQARQLENRGETAQAELLLKGAASSAYAGAPVLEAYAHFLDSHGSGGTRAAYEKLLASLPASAQERRAAVLRRLVLLALAEGEHATASRYLSEYHAAGGGDWGGVTIPGEPPSGAAFSTIAIPGPLRSFLRMAAVSQETQPDELLLDLARSVVINGFHASGRQEGLEPTEFLKLLTRYISQARELEKLAGDSKVIRVESCESEQAGELLRILGYRMRGGCGREVVLETVNSTRAFLTIDSGFPLAELEQALRTNRPFALDYRPSQIPVAWTADYWVGTKEKQEGGFIEAFIADPSLCRFYLAMSKPDPDTVEQLRKSIPAQRLKAFAHVLDFYGSMFEIRDGKAIVPGGARSAKMWEELTGASPDQGAAFFDKLTSRDDGWLASYFDALLRINGPLKDYLTEPARLKRFYTAIRGRVTSPGPARPVFRANTDMLLLTTRLRLDADGRPHVPGGIAVWSNLFVKHPQGKYDAKLSRLAKDWKEPDDVLEGLFGLCRRAMDNEPLRIFMTLSDLELARPRPLEAATVDRLIRDYRKMSAQYLILAEAPLLSDATIVRYLDYTAQASRIGDLGERADRVGMFQASVGLWQILCHQGAIPDSQADSTLAGILGAFEGARNAAGLFDAGRASIGFLLKGAGVTGSAAPHQQILNLLAGAGTQPLSDFQTRVANELQSYMEAQRLIPLTQLFQVADHADNIAKGEKLNAALLNGIGSRLSEIALARASLSTVERNSLAMGFWADRHIDQQKRLNLRSIVERAGTDPERLRNVRSSLAPLLRDTLVGLNYAYYAPPGAQLLRTNPLFVRGHDFVGTQGTSVTWQMTGVFGSGWPASAGGRLVGSLAGLPYALAESEQDFLVPTREQALIWNDLAPQLLVSAKVPRWWDVTPSQMHWLALHLRYGTTLMAEAALDAGLRARVLGVLAEQATPAQTHEIRQLLERGEVDQALAKVTPSELFVLGREMLARYPSPRDPLAAEVRRMSAESPGSINYQAIARAFGTPKPILTSSYRSDLLNLRTFPTLMGYSSRILAESWESNTIYWAALADELCLPPGQLNILIPEWTQATIEQIFATHLDDWPAVLRSLRYVGAQVRLKARGEEARSEGIAQVTEGERP